ncbi:MAG TPA: PAS domain-containing protein [Rhodocyclaceae bacterium]|nr:PAS domain-containing protein [Rhodocyclaceae bacterium]
MARLQEFFARLRQAARGRDSRPPTAPATERRLRVERRAALRALYNHEVRVRCAAQEVGFGTYELDCISGRIHWSPELRSIAGQPLGTDSLALEQLLGLVHPEDRERVRLKLEAAMAPEGNGDFNDEHRLLRPDGAVIWVKAIGRTFFSGEGQNRQALGATGVVMDVTDRKLAEAALVLREQHFDQAVRGAAIGIWNWDLRTGEVAWSERCRQLYGFPSGQPITEEQFLTTLHPDDRDRTAAALHEAVDAHREYSIEYRIRSPDNRTIRWIHAIGSAFYDDRTQAPVSMSGIVIDITERKLQEGRLLDSNEQLASQAEQDRAELGEAQEALANTKLEIQQFAYIAAHDLQTPLRSITGFAQLLQKEYRGRTLDAQGDAWLDQLVTASLHMHGLIQDLLTYSGITSLGRPFRATDMNQVFDEVVSSAETAIREAGAAVTRDELPTVTGDPIQLATLLQNLIENGIKYRGGNPPRVHVSARRDGREWVFSVRDNGIGIAEKHHEQIFEIFRRLHTQRAYAGSGIGLAICRRVVQRHGGRIWVDSEPGTGSDFQFSLPAT